jgi:hypothetical protein
MLPVAARDPLTRHLETVRLQHERDLVRDSGWVELPAALTRKYPNAGREPAGNGSSRQPPLRRPRAPASAAATRLHETVVQRAVPTPSARPTSAKHASCHTFATPSPRILGDGCDIHVGRPRPPRRWNPMIYHTSSIAAGRRAQPRRQLL